MRKLRNLGVLSIITCALVACARSTPVEEPASSTEGEAPAAVEAPPPSEVPPSGAAAESPMVCSDSDKRATVFLRECDTGVANVAVGDCTVADHLRVCVAGPADDFPRCIAKSSNRLMELGAIDGPDKGRIQKCAAADEGPDSE